MLPFQFQTLNPNDTPIVRIIYNNKIMSETGTSNPQQFQQDCLTLYLKWVEIRPDCEPNGFASFKLYMPDHFHQEAAWALYFIEKGEQYVNIGIDVTPH